MNRTKLTLSPREAVETNYDTKELFTIEKAHFSDSVANNKIIIIKGTNTVSIDKDVEVKEEVLKDFAERNFKNAETAFKRIKTLCGLNNHVAFF